MQEIERQVRREARAMTRREVITKAIAKRLSWVQAAEIIRIKPRQMRRIRWRVEHYGMDAVMDQRGGRPRRKRIKAGTIELLCRLKHDVYPDFSLRHFYEHVTENHGVKVSYNWLRLMLQEAGVVQQEPARGKYRRQRERRPMVGMLVHLNASTHEWIAGLPRQDLVVALDDAGRPHPVRLLLSPRGHGLNLRRPGIGAAQLWPYCELYTDRGSHFCQSEPAGAVADEQNGQVSRALRALGIRQILAYSPQARSRSERAFGTIQGRLPQELRHQAIKDYAAASDYLQRQFIPDFNRRFTIKPAQPESAFVKLAGIELELVLSSKYERVVRNDNTVTFKNLVLQLPSTRQRLHFVSCPVIVHQFANGTLAVSYQGRLLARYDNLGAPSAQTPISSARRCATLGQHSCPGPLTSSPTAALGLSRIKTGERPRRIGLSKVRARSSATMHSGRGITRHRRTCCQFC
jgi:transposase